MTPEELQRLRDKAADMHHEGYIETAEIMTSAADTIERLQQEVARLQTWDGLMGTLDKLYPEDVVPTLPDSETRDPGARIVSLVRQVARLTADAERTEKVIRAARSVWLFSRGYVSEGVEIPADTSDEALEEEEAARSLSLYREIKSLDAAVDAARAR